MASGPRDLTTHTAIAPHKTLLLIVSAIGGTIGIFYPRVIASSIDQSFPPPFQVVWFAGLALTSVIALYGVLQRSLAGLLWERVALLAQAVLLVAYMIALVGVNGEKGTGAALFYAGFAIANVYRCWIITHTLKLFPPPHLRRAWGSPRE